VRRLLFDPVPRGATVFGVALCSARFLGLAVAALVLVAGFGAIWVRARRRARPSDVRVGLRSTRE
jgi:hypothetical protein